MANPKLPSWYGLNLSSMLVPNAGNIFYLDGTNGLDTNDGLTPDTPFLTVTHALTECAAGNDDYIVILYYPSAGAAGETWPIDVNMADVHIIGGSFNPMDVKILKPTGDTAAMTLSANGVEIAGLEFGGGASHGCIETGDSGYSWRQHIHHCDFGWIYTAQDGILAAGTCDMAHASIHDNRFGVNLTRSGIYINHNATRTRIERNLWTGVASGQVGLYVANTMAQGMILDNRFKVADAATGEAITLTATATDDALIDGNRAMQGVVAMGNVAFRDLGTNHWGLNYVDITATMPVTA